MILGLHHPTGRASETVAVALELRGCPGDATGITGPESAMPRTRSNNLGEDRLGRCLESLFAGLTDGFCSVGGYEAWDRLRVSVVSTPGGSACSADACRCKAPTPLAYPRRAFTPRVRPPTPMGLDRVMLFCPSPVPHEVEKQRVMMGTNGDNARWQTRSDCVSPGRRPVAVTR